MVHKHTGGEYQKLREVIVDGPQDEYEWMQLASEHVYKACDEHPTVRLGGTVYEQENPRYIRLHRDKQGNPYIAIADITLATTRTGDVLPPGTTVSVQIRWEPLTWLKLKLKGLFNDE